MNKLKSTKPLNLPKDATINATLFVGVMVHYTLESGPGSGEHRPAIVVKVRDVTTGNVDLQVFTDGANDGSAAGMVFRASVLLAEQLKRPGTWHWIEKV